MIKGNDFFLDKIKNRLQRRNVRVIKNSSVSEEHKQQQKKSYSNKKAQEKIAKFNDITSDRWKEKRIAKVKENKFKKFTRLKLGKDSKNENDISIDDYLI
jgi:uncharacterized protein YcbK (DUF882 family)